MGAARFSVLLGNPADRSRRPAVGHIYCFLEYTVPTIAEGAGRLAVLARGLGPPRCSRSTAAAPSPAAAGSPAHGRRAPRRRAGPSPSRAGRSAQPRRARGTRPGESPASRPGPRLGGAAPARAGRGRGRGPHGAAPPPPPGRRRWGSRVPGPAGVSAGLRRRPRPRPPQQGSRRPADCRAALPAPTRWPLSQGVSSRTAPP